MKRSHCERFSNVLDTCVLFHNAMIIHEQELVASGNKPLSSYDLQAMIKNLRPILDPNEEVHYHILQDIAKRIKLSKAAFFRERKNGNMKINLPKIQSKLTSVSFKEHKNGFKLSFDKNNFINKVKISGVGSIAVRNKMRLPKEARIKCATLKKETTGFFLSVVVEFEEDKSIVRERKVSPLFPYSTLQHKQNINSDVALDLGIGCFVASSDGDKITCPALEERAKEIKALNKQKRIKEAEHKKSERAVESRRLRNLRRKIAKHHGKTRRIRRDFAFKVARYFLFNYSQIFIEDLNVVKIIDKNKPNGHDFVRRIHSAAWNQFIKILQDAQGDALVHLVNPAWTSCICAYCLAPKVKKLNERLHFCLDCGTIEDRDVMAAKVIKIQGLNPEKLSVPKAWLKSQSVALRAQSSVAAKMQ